MSKSSAKKTSSKENLISDSENDSEYVFDNGIVEVEVHTNENDLSYEDKNYVMQKFLDNKSNESSKIESLPIAKQRTKKPNTIDNDLVKEFRKDDDADSSVSKASNATYEVPVPKKRLVKQEKVTEARPTSMKKKQPEEIELQEFVTFENERNKESTKGTYRVKPRDRKTLIKTDESDTKTQETSNLGYQLSISKPKTPNENEISIVGCIPPEKLSKKLQGNETKKTSKNERKQKVNNEEVEKQEVQEEKNDERELLTLKIEKCDRLLLDSYALQPKIRVHFIDSETGEYIRKSDPNKTAFISKNKDQYDYIPAYITKPYSLIQNRQIFPNWNERITINEDFDYLQNNTTLLMLFDLIESLPQEKNEDRIICWAFLKPQHNYNQNLRLQLYFPLGKNTKSVLDSYGWWKKGKRRKYPSTLYVTLKSALIPKNFPEHSIANKEDLNIETDAVINQREKSANLQVTSKFPESVGNEKLYELKTLLDGCFVHKFNQDGSLLAVATSEDNVYSIIIYTTNNMEMISRLEKHDGLIYDLAWRNKELISASADCTIGLWDLTLNKLEASLPHPSFVYCCTSCWDSDLIASGCYDRIVRIWSASSYQLLTELKEHKGYVTSICFNKHNSYMYSSDSVGCIIMWQNEQNSWLIKQKIAVLDLQNVIINEVILHRRQKRLIVNSRDGFIRLVDIKTGFVMQTYSKGAAEIAQNKCAITPCSTFLIAGNELGDIFIWNLENGKVEYTFCPFHIKIPIHCVQFYNNLITISHFGNHKPVLVYQFKTTILDAHLQQKMARSKTDLTSLQKQGTNMRLILEKFDNIITAS